MPMKRQSSAQPSIKQAKRKKAYETISDDSDNAGSQSSDEDMPEPTSHHEDEKV
jgi:hypothetical protein